MLVGIALIYIIYVFVLVSVMSLRWTLGLFFESLHSTMEPKFAKFMNARRLLYVLLYMKMHFTWKPFSILRTNHVKQFKPCLRQYLSIINIISSFHALIYLLIHAYIVGTRKYSCRIVYQHVKIQELDACAIIITKR